MSTTQVLSLLMALVPLQVHEINRKSIHRKPLTCMTSLAISFGLIATSLRHKAIISANIFFQDDMSGMVQANVGQKLLKHNILRFFSMTSCLDPEANSM
jgi:hypothetical protein